MFSRNAIFTKRRRLQCKWFHVLVWLFALLLPLLYVGALVSNNNMGMSAYNVEDKKSSYLCLLFGKFICFALPLSLKNCEKNIQIIQTDKRPLLPELDAAARLLCLTYHWVLVEVYLKNVKNKNKNRTCNGRITWYICLCLVLVCLWFCLWLLLRRGKFFWWFIWLQQTYKQKRTKDSANEIQPAVPPDTMRACLADKKLIDWRRSAKNVK